jgi:hypothetical protein
VALRGTLRSPRWSGQPKVSQVQPAELQVLLPLLQKRAEAGLMLMIRSFSFFLPFYGNVAKHGNTSVRKLLHLTLNGSIRQ